MDISGSYSTELTVQMQPEFLGSYIYETENLPQALYVLIDEVISCNQGHLQGYCTGGNFSQTAKASLKLIHYEIFNHSCIKYKLTPRENYLK